jgi:hypothetical protein
MIFFYCGLMLTWSYLLRISWAYSREFSCRKLKANVHIISWWDCYHVIMILLIFHSSSFQLSPLHPLTCYPLSKSFYILKIQNCTYHSPCCVAYASHSHGVYRLKPLSSSCHGYSATNCVKCQALTHITMVINELMFLMNNALKNIVICRNYKCWLRPWEIFENFILKFL